MKDMRQPYDEEKIKYRKKRKLKGYLCLTSLPAWWTRVERQEKQFFFRKRKEAKNAEKDNFVRKFFPDCNSSPGGTFDLTKKKLTITLARKRRVKEILEKGECSESEPDNINDVCF